MESTRKIFQDLLAFPGRLKGYFKIHAGSSSFIMVHLSHSQFFFLILLLSKKTSMLLCNLWNQKGERSVACRERVRRIMKMRHQQKNLTLTPAKYFKDTIYVRPDNPNLAYNYM